MHSYSASVTCNILPAFKITIVTCQCLLYDNKHVSLQLSAIKTLCWKLREIQYWNLNKTILIWLWKQPCIKVYVPNFITSSLLALFLITASAAEPRELWTPKRYPLKTILDRPAHSNEKIFVKNVLASSDQYKTTLNCFPIMKAACWVVIVYFETSNQESFQ